ncbi:Ent-kaur-16-ene synthase [Abeliophyllum distichum]|uniref:Ent-kaur-16-ene synthase n=1 Tax=Abeliophyllum distichum TaxID=126358 RepID=A0ABD1TYK8_9LAMI
MGGVVATEAFSLQTVVYSPPTELLTRAVVSLPVEVPFQNVEESILERIREKFGKVEVSPSSYDTAWVAMVPSRESPNKPCFPQCLNWIVENQKKDGSWGLDSVHVHPSLVKDSLSCTLASLLALRKWNVGEQLVHRGLNFMRSNIGAVSDRDQFSPIGFDIIFPGMINCARQLNLMVPLDPVMVDLMLNNRDSIIKGNRNLAYVAEGLGESCNWEELLTQQISNGSLFNSPATTAASLIHCYNDKCFEHLISVLKLNKSWVPTIYPADIYTHLCMVDTLGRLGIDRYFTHEIERVLNETYRCWEQNNEEIVKDVTCCALAFRLLRMKGYEVTSDKLAAYTEQEHFFNIVSVQFTGVPTILELYRASQVTINEDESVLDQIHAWTSTFLKQQLQNRTIVDKRLSKRVEYSLKTFNATLERVESRQSIEQYDPNNYRILKTAYRCPNIDNMDFLVFSRQDFNLCQAQHQKELQQLERWYTDSRLDVSKLGRSVLHTCYFLSAAILFDTDISEARIAYAQVVALTSRIDDLFDLYGSREELINMIKLVKKWDERPKSGYSSEEVGILFTAVYNHVNEWAAKILIKQGRCIKHLLISLWLEFLDGCMKEVEWSSDYKLPTLEEYLSVGCMSIAGQVSVLTPLHVLGPKFSEELLTTAECLSLCKHVCLIFRLLNDVRTFERERSERTLNSVSLLVLQSKGAITEEEAIAKVYEMIEQSKRKLLKTVLQTNGSLVPRECKNLFWYTANNCYYLYRQRDEFSSPRELRDHMNAVIFEPFILPPHVG